MKEYICKIQLDVFLVFVCCLALIDGVEVHKHVRKDREICSGIVVFCFFGLSGNLTWDWLDTMIFGRTTFELKYFCFFNQYRTLVVFYNIVIFFGRPSIQYQQKHTSIAFDETNSPVEGRNPKQPPFGWC